jgi:hypothetical protein
MFTNKAETYTLASLVNDLESALGKARKAHLDKHGIERALELALQLQRTYIAASLRF